MQRDAPTAQQRILAAIAVAVHGPYASARDRLTLLHPVTEPMCHNGVAMQAEVVLKSAVKEAFAAMRPQDLDQISQAVERALANWPPRFQALDGGIHRPLE